MGERLDGLSLASRGSGPLLQRDYWSVIDACRFSPSALMERIARHFERFAPELLVQFERQAEARPLAPGDELRVHIVGAGTFSVRVIHKDAQSLTLGTLARHPEAGRITFGAYRNGRGDVVFHIRSRARSSSRFTLLGFKGAGEAMQTNTWTDFINRVAVYAGRGVIGRIRAETTIASADESDEEARAAATFAARGD